MEKAITVALLAFSENYRQPVNEDLTSIWMNTLGGMSIEAIKTGTRRCLTECDFFPALSVFIEKTKKNDMARPSTWEDAPKLEHKKQKVKMPADVKQAVAKLMREASKIKRPFVPFRKVYGHENGLDFILTQDSKGRDFVDFTNRPPTKPSFMNGY